MDIQRNIIIFDALSQETRLRTFRMLIKAGKGGLAAGAISKALGIPHNTMSFHLSHLSNSGIITSQREGRSIIYKANFDIIRDFISFLVQDCCSDEIASIHKDKESGCDIIRLADCCSDNKKSVSNG